MTTRHGGADRISTKTRLAAELAILGALLAELRERSSLQQQEVAIRLGMPASYLSKIESGTRRLDVIELIRLAEAMDIDPAAVVKELQLALSEKRT